MILINDKILVSLEVIEEQFLCNLDACKGACCWEGDSGAPLEPEELETLERPEVDLDERLDLDSVEESMNLKSQNEIYYELYKTALQKAKDIRKNAIEAFLSAKDIKVKYGLDDLTDSDESDFDEAFDEAFDES